MLLVAQLRPGELKSNCAANRLKTWLDLGTYMREASTAQDTSIRLGLYLCESFMRIWEFDRPRGIASTGFNINEDGQQCVSVTLGLLWMNDEQLGFGPTITTEDGWQFITVN